MPAVTTKVVAIEVWVYARTRTDSVTPVSAAYPRKSSVAVPGASRSTRAERKNTSPICAANRTKEQQMVRRQDLGHVR